MFPHNVAATHSAKDWRLPCDRLPLHSIAGRLTGTPIHFKPSTTPAEGFFFCASQKLAHAPSSVFARMICGLQDGMDGIDAGRKALVDRNATENQIDQKHDHPKDGEEQVAVVHGLTPNTVQ